MNRDEHHRKLERMYGRAPINRFYRPTLSITDRRAEISLNADERMHHAAHAVHGSVYFKMLDDAAFFAVNSVVTDSFVLTVQFDIHLLRPVVGGPLRAVGRLVNPSRRLYIAASELFDERGRLLARGSGSFMPSRMALTAGMGYV
jgi:uncharacterized protein (TIGR00369 family)